MPGQSFTVKVRITNHSRRTIRPRIAIRLRPAGIGKRGRLVASKRGAKLRAKQSHRYRIGVRLPRKLAAGAYALIANIKCVESSGPGVTPSGGEGRRALGGAPPSGT